MNLIETYNHYLVCDMHTIVTEYKPNEIKINTFSNIRKIKCNWLKELLHLNKHESPKHTFEFTTSNAERIYTTISEVGGL